MLGKFALDGFDLGLSRCNESSRHGPRTIYGQYGGLYIAYHYGWTDGENILCQVHPIDCAIYKQLGGSIYRFVTYALIESHLPFAVHPNKPSAYTSLRPNVQVNNFRAVRRRHYLRLSKSSRMDRLSSLLIAARLTDLNSPSTGKHSKSAGAIYNGGAARTQPESPSFDPHCSCTGQSLAALAQKHGRAQNSQPLLQRSRH
jgi:hypothetical protein